MFLKLLHTNFTLLFSVVFLFGMVNFSVAQSEHIERYDIDIKVDTSNVIRVTETIKVYASGDKIKRGIFRSLPKTRLDKYGKSIPVEFEVVSVLQNGENAQFFIKDEGWNLSIYIGERDVELEPGFYTYEIVYLSPSQIGFYDEHDELFWMAIGQDWEMVIDSAIATVHLPDKSYISQHECYTMQSYRRLGDCEGQLLDSNVIRFTAVSLKEKEGLTIAVGFDKGIIPPPKTFINEKVERVIYTPSIWEVYGSSILVGIVSVVLLLYFIITWMMHGKDPVSPISHPLFSPPRNLSPAAVGMIFHNQFWEDLISVSLVQLAVKKFIHIEETQTGGVFGFFKTSKYTITKLKKSNKSLSIEERKLFSNLFRSKKKLVLDGKFNGAVFAASKAFEESLLGSYQSMMNAGNNKKFMIFPVLLLFTLIAYIGINDWTLSYSAISIGILTTVLYILIVSFNFVINIFNAKAIQYAKVMIWVISLLLFCVIGYFIIIEAHTEMAIQTISLIALMILIISLACYYFLIRRPNDKKVKIQSEIEGFKMFLTKAEVNLIKQFNPPEMTPELFEEFLPYAIALGVEDVWGNKFSDYLSKSMIEPQSYTSTWYSGNRAFSSKFSQNFNSAISNTMAHSAATGPRGRGSNKSSSNSYTHSSYSSTKTWGSSSRSSGSWSSGISSSSSRSAGGGGGGGGW